MARSLPLTPSPATYSRLTGFASGSYRGLPYVPRGLVMGLTILPKRSRSRRVKWTCFTSPSLHAELRECSWFPVEVPDDSCAGWYVHPPAPRKGEGGTGSLVAGVVAWAGVLLVSFSCFYMAKKGYRLQMTVPFHHLSEIFKQSSSIENLSIDTELNKQDNISVAVEDESRKKSDSLDQTKENVADKKIKYIAPAIDITQQEAMSLLQKLEIMEKDVILHRLCTRREYARWLIKANSLLERNPKHRIVPSLVMAGSKVQAFDDVSADDPDFPFIQAIGEAGIVPSKLSDVKYRDGSCSQPVERCEFSPESLITRLDLISWKLQTEYLGIPDAEEKMIRKNLGFMDLSKLSPEVLRLLFMDTLASERGIVRRVFGNIRRIQPEKPVTNAQVAVALTSGRMADAIQSEFSRAEAERLTRMANIKDIRSEFIHKGDIRRHWEMILEAEKLHGLEVQEELKSALLNLDTMKLAHKKETENYIKERAALDCQKQLLTGLKEEVDRMHEKLAKEKAMVAEEQKSLEEMLIDLHQKQDAVMEAKSILEAEKEAIRILRTWVEDGARQSQFRAKVLENAVQRWKWDSRAGLPKTPEE